MAESTLEEDRAAGKISQKSPLKADKPSAQNLNINPRFHLFFESFLCSLHLKY